jgi:glutathione synthase/RimK-type ligase-like ATP-grasp enzyme
MGRRAGPLEVALVTHEGLPQLADDDRLLLPELERLGVRGRPTVWSDPDVPWAEFDAAVLRSTWDYHLRRDEFLDWVDRAASETDLWNRAATVRWNSHKSYLRGLEARGVPIVPTVWSDGSRSLRDLLRERGWERAVFKPSVSAAAHRTHLVTRETLAENEPVYARLCAEQEVLVQPYLPGVESPGEHSLIFLDGAYSHAVDRVAALARPRGPVGGRPVAASPAERELGLRVLDALGTPTLYARVDMVRDEDDLLRLTELELIEPSLFLDTAPDAASTFARAIGRRVRPPVDHGSK